MVPRAHEQAFELLLLTYASTVLGPEREDFGHADIRS